MQHIPTDTRIRRWTNGKTTSRGWWDVSIAMLKCMAHRNIQEIQTLFKNLNIFQEWYSQFKHVYVPLNTRLLQIFLIIIIPEACVRIHQIIVLTQKSGKCPHTVHVSLAVPFVSDKSTMGFRPPLSSCHLTARDQIHLILQARGDLLFSNLLTIADWL